MVIRVDNQEVLPGARVVVTTFQQVTYSRSTAPGTRSFPSGLTSSQKQRETITVSWQHGTRESRSLHRPRYPPVPITTPQQREGLRWDHGIPVNREPLFRHRRQPAARAVIPPWIPLYSGSPAGYTRYASDCGGQALLSVRESPRTVPRRSLHSPE